MTSSPTPSLRLELQATGDNSGTWGTKANENFTLLETAIAGYLAIDIHGSSGGTYTLSANNYAPDEERNAMIAFTGALTGNVLVVVPTQDQKWHFINSTSGSFTVTVKTAAGTGIAITQGKKTVLFCDGVNVLSLASLDTLDGVVPVASGGFGLASPAVHAVLLGAGASPITTASPGAAGQVLTSNGVSADPSFQSPGGGGTTSVAAGGTGLTAVTAHNLPVGNGTSPLNLIGPGTAGQVLTSNGSSSDPTFQSAAAGSSFVSIHIQTFTSTGTYTPTSGMKYCRIRLQAPGGGSGGCPSTSGSQVAIGGSGAGGGYAEDVFTAAQIGASKTVTIGSPGTAGSAGSNPGGTGGTTSVGALLSAAGGTGGLAGINANSSGFSLLAGVAGGSATIGTIKIQGGASGYGGAEAAFNFVNRSGPGGNATLGNVLDATYRVFGGSNAAAIAGLDYGAGAVGGYLDVSSSSIGGAIGGHGIVIIEEFCNV